MLFYLIFHLQKFTGNLSASRPGRAWLRWLDYILAISWLPKKLTA